MEQLVNTEEQSGEVTTVTCDAVVSISWYFLLVTSHVSCRNIELFNPVLQLL